MNKNNFKKIKNFLDKKINFKKIFPKKRKKRKKGIQLQPGVLVSLFILLAIIAGAAGAALASLYWQKNISEFLKANHQLLIPRDEEIVVQLKDLPQLTGEEQIIYVVESISPSVVSIVITRDLPVLERYYVDPFGRDWSFWGFQFPQYREQGRERREVGSGTGFIISEDGMILTNRHVLLEEGAGYTILLNDGQKYPAKVLAKDPLHDLAIIQIDQSDIREDERRTFPAVRLGDSANLRIGQTVIAIGNALGEFQNTVSTGVISGLDRDIVARGAGVVEVLRGVIQTDAAINQGNSGGPLLNSAGEVIGVNVARSVDGENIGFSLPINLAKRGIKQVKATGTIVYPFLGIYYTMITKELSERLDLPVDYGAWVGRDRIGRKTETAIFPNSPAQIIGLRRDDIILKFDEQKLDQGNPLPEVIIQYFPGDKVSLKILRDNKEIFKEVILGKR